MELTKSEANGNGAILRAAPRFTRASSAEPEPESYYTLQEAALITHTSVMALCRMIRAGRLRAELAPDGDGGEYRVPADVVQELAQGIRTASRSIPAPPPPMPAAAPTRPASTPPAAPQHEEIEHLRREIEQVKIQLAERDAQVAGLEQQQRARAAMLQLQIEQSKQAHAEMKAILAAERAERERLAAAPVPGPAPRSSRNWWPFRNKSQEGQ
ncbi:MAG TPA: hypothetical protein VFJ58_10460 [Armatimonadota bacterium]|nr:hypothetical protein [Armatimonadota bacterium]